MTKDELISIMPYAKARADTFLEPLNMAMEEFEVNSRLRKAAFLAQVGHESGQLHYVCELASGAAYEGRADLGNTELGDGIRFKGRGLVQVTGRANYLKCSMALFSDDRLLQFPELLEDQANACRSAGWFWRLHGLNELADAGDFLGITKRINGGTNGLEDRQALYAKALEVLA